jgi:hypothetical protein
MNGDGLATDYKVPQLEHPATPVPPMPVIGLITPTPNPNFAVTGDAMYPKPA